MQVGPFAVIEGGTKIGDHTVIMSHASVLYGTTVGSHCRIFQGAVVGGIPQDLKYDGADTRLVIGDNTTIREFVTIGRGTKSGEPGTVIGSQTLLMAYVHVGHDSIIGDHVIVANSVNLGGYVHIHDYASIGAGTPVHQFCHIGTHTFIGGGYRLVQDVPPYILASGNPLHYTGINSVGLRRHGFTAETRTTLKQVYKLIYRSTYNLPQAVEIIKNDMEPTPEVKTVLAFIEDSTRGLI